VSLLGAGIAVAGISSPLAEVRSPLPGTRTTSRSPVSLTSVKAPDVLRDRGFLGFGAEGFVEDPSEVVARGIRAGV